MTPKQAKQLTTDNHWFRRWMPYTFQKLEHPTRAHCYLPLNRDYKPLGAHTQEHVDYSLFLNSHAILFSSEPSEIKGVWAGEGLYLYSNDPQSRVDYFDRFQTLMSRKLACADE